jgi:glucose-6-phosphate 1-epimerase
LNLPEKVADLDKRFGIAGIAEVLPGNGGLTKVVVSSAGVHGEMYLHGGQVTSWAPAGTGELLYVSPNASWIDGRAIRGGVPICFPWFGGKADDPTAPAHGLVRTRPWQLESIARTGSDVTVSMAIESSQETRSSWPFDFRLVCRATFASQLQIELIVTNTGPSAFSFEEALHTYFRVGESETVFIRGLNGTRYLDTADQRKEKTQNGDVRFSGEIDNVYWNSPDELELFDPALNRRVTIGKKNSLTTVVWNPWTERSRVLSDLGAGNWKDFVCIETSNVAPYAVQLNPGHQHSMAAILRPAGWLP